MTKASNNYQLLIQKLDQFIRKYYINNLIRGTLYSVGVILALFTLFSVLEYYYYFPSATRKLMLFSFIGISIVSVTAWMALPLLNYFKLGKVISHQQAAAIIGQHFGNVKDKLLNVLQLKAQSEQIQDASLINASIDQKVEDLKPVPFRSAINLSQNRKYLRFALPPLLLLLLILLIDASIIESGTTRLMNADKEFEREAPFQFSIDDDVLSVVQFEDYDLTVKVNGDVLPNDVYIDVDNYQYKLTKVDNNTFAYKFRKVAKDMKFFFSASGFSSKPYELEVLKKPNIVGFDVRVDYPAYTGLLDERITNIGDLVVPVGTRISWNFNARNTDEVAVKFSDQDVEKTLERIGNEAFTVSRQLSKDATYMVYVSNKNLQKADSVSYTLSAVPDVHPTIAVKQFEDSTQTKVLFFAGEASDDYGLSKLLFHYNIERENGTKINKAIPIQAKMGKQAQYDYTFNLTDIGVQLGDKITYYFEVFDNDGINGAKSAKTSMMTYEIPTEDEYQKMEAKNNDEIKSELEQAIKDSKKLQQEIKNLQNEILQKKNLDWQDRKKLEELLERQKEIEKRIEEAKKDFEENIKNQQEFDEPDQDIKDKQDKIEELFEEVMDDDMKELMQKIEDLLEELDKEELMQQLDEFQMDDNEQEKNYERMLELFKQLEFENEMRKATDDLNELAKKQEELSEKTQDNKQSSDDLKKQQEELNKEFEKIQEQLDDLQKKNEELQSPMKMDDLKEQSDEIKQNQQNSSQQLQQKQQKNASKSQKKASEGMKNMANSMNMMMQSAQMQQMQEDIAALRQLLENLVTLSFEQEGLMEESRKLQVNTPSYVALVQDQYKVKDDFALVEDSLNALAKRVFQIETFVTEKVTDIKKDLGRGIKQLEDRKKSPAGVSQQRVMTGLNDLALMLSEVMQQMQQQMANQMQGAQMCQSPGQGTPMQQLGQQQQQLGQQLQDIMDKQGDKPGQGQGQKSGKQGQKGGKDGKKWSKDFAQAAAQQAAIRRALEDLQRKKSEQGQGSKELQKLIEEMDKIETDLVNKKITAQMMKRQQDILNRMLKAAEAEREQEYENDRQAQTAKTQEPKRPKALEDYIKQREAEIELYQSVSPNLKPYYKTLVEEYYDALKAQ